MDLLKTLLAVWLVLAVVIVSKNFIRVLDRAAEGRVSTDTLLSILSLKTLSISTGLLPAAVFMAVLMVLGRMYRDQEMSALASAGGGCGTVYRAVYLMVLPVSVATGFLYLNAAPWAEASMAKLMQQDTQSTDLKGLAAGKFSEHNQGDLVFYIETISEDNVMHQVFVQSRQNERFATITSETAQIRELPGGRYVVFQKGERVQGSPGSLMFQVERFFEYGVRVEDAASAIKYGHMAKTSLDLLNSSALKDLAELQRRWSGPVTVLLFAFIAVPLAQISPRGGSYGNILAGFLIYFIHGNLTKVSQLWVGQGLVAPWLGWVGVNLLLFLSGLVLLLRLQGWFWVQSKLKHRGLTR